MLGRRRASPHAGRAMSLLTRIRDFFVEPVADAPLALPEPIAKAADVPQMPATPITEPVGAPGVVAVGGYVQTNERSSDLTGTERQRKFHEWIRVVPEVGAAVRASLILAGSPKWDVMPYKADDADEPTPEDEERAAWLKRQLSNMDDTPWSRSSRARARRPAGRDVLGVDGQAGRRRVRARRRDDAAAGDDHPLRPRRARQAARHRPAGPADLRRDPDRPVAPGLLAGHPTTTHPRAMARCASWPRRSAGSSCSRSWPTRVREGRQRRPGDLGADRGGAGEDGHGQGRWHHLRRGRLRGGDAADQGLRERQRSARARV